ncbi:V-type ATP synthase subunit K [Erysipelothrix sp. HDW6A]|uniref:V-type ATP synthase subunit K n=1 Tax=Erysipelothrix sp. HDW6A TaxID=2714928 RepID=UPI0014093A93|nr:V-type ATP synthase subunit K [Erysipelothrix sp. HDW6A]QIK57238.1 V-type ATP synthase subunit K [Erysipelothrix sp. HDW6A]
MGFFEFIYQNGGLVMAVFGMALVVIIPGMSSGKGVGMVGEATTGLMMDEPEKFGKSLLLQMMPASQGLYGFVIAIMTLSRLTPNMPLQEGLYIFVSCLPMAIVGGPTALAQARVAVSGVQLLARNENEMTKNIIYAVMVETYALLAFVSSIILLSTVSF